MIQKIDRALAQHIITATAGTNTRTFPSTSAKGIDMQNEDLSGFDFTGADLAGADLRGANLTSTILRGTNLEGATYDEKTQFPSEVRIAIDAFNSKAEEPGGKPPQVRPSGLHKA